MQTQIYDKSYTADQSVVTAATQFAAVVVGAEDGGCAMPAGQNAPKFLGFAQTVPTILNAPVSVRKLGISRAIGFGVIHFGDHLAINSAAGDVYSIETAVEAGDQVTAANFYSVGTAETSTVNNGDTVEVFVNPQAVTL